jgi:hypothetical protein
MSEFNIEHLVNSLSEDEPRFDFGSILDSNKKPPEDLPKIYDNMTADDIKSILLQLYRFKNRIFHIATEVMYADVLFYKENKRSSYITEIEIKTSFSDFKADLKKDKHSYYKDGKSYQYIKPDLFYYCMPETLYIKYKDKIKLPNDSYGIIIIDRYGNAITIKDAIRLNTAKFADKDTIKKIIMRMSSEIATFWKQKSSN